MYKYARMYPAATIEDSPRSREAGKQLSEATDFVAFGDSESASAHKLPRPKCTPVYNLIVGL
jgi:hypothetical protein